jgi:hypothetical protein
VRSDGFVVVEWTGNDSGAFGGHGDRSWHDNQTAEIGVHLDDLGDPAVLAMRELMRSDMAIRMLFCFGDLCSGGPILEGLPKPLVAAD